MGSIEKRRRRLPDGTIGITSWRARYRDVNGRTAIANVRTANRCGAVPGGQRD